MVAVGQLTGAIAHDGLSSWEIRKGLRKNSPA